AERAHDPARRALRIGEHPARRRDGRPRPRVLHDRAAQPREGQGPARVAAFDGSLRRAAARHLRRTPRAARGAGRPALHSRALPAEPRAPRAGGGARGAGDRVMAAASTAIPKAPMKPEDILRAIAAARGTAICVPTMTTSPAWRTIAPDDLSVGCVGFMGGAS